MVRPERFELPTYRFVACCSIQLSYERIQREKLNKILIVVKCHGNISSGMGPARRQWH